MAAEASGCKFLLDTRKIKIKCADVAESLVKGGTLSMSATLCRRRPQDKLLKALPQPCTLCLFCVTELPAKYIFRNESDLARLALTCAKSGQVLISAAVLHPPPYDTHKHTASQPLSCCRCLIKIRMRGDSVCQ